MRWSLTNVTFGIEFYLALSGLEPNLFALGPGATRYALAPGYYIVRLRR